MIAVFRLAVVLALVALVLAVVGGCPSGGDEQGTTEYMQPDPEPGTVAPPAAGAPAPAPEPAPAPANEIQEDDAPPPPPPGE